jgi:hypothetical protein
MTVGTATAAGKGSVFLPPIGGLTATVIVNEYFGPNISLVVVFAALAGLIAFYMSPLGHKHNEEVTGVQALCYGTCSLVGSLWLTQLGYSVLAANFERFTGQHLAAPLAFVFGYSIQLLLSKVAVVISGFVFSWRGISIGNLSQQDSYALKAKPYQSAATDADEKPSKYAEVDK